MQQPEVLLEARNVAKSFGSVDALKNVSLKILAGRVHTLLGENGAGKSTLMKVLAGVHQPSSGNLLVRGKTATFSGPADAQKAGIAIVFQELSLASNLTVAENIFAINLPQRFGLVNHKEVMRQARELLADLGIGINPAAQVASLSMAQRQLVEIAKALSTPSQVVIMDEPTSSLSDNEAEVLFRIIKRLTAQGKAVVYISHRMEEIMRISDDISVMRDGEYICTVQKQDANIEQLITLMVGRKLNDIYPKRLPPNHAPAEKPLLEVHDLAVSGKFAGVNFVVNPGEIVGLFGLVGAGRTDIMNALFGVTRPSHGTMWLDGKQLRLKTPADAIAKGIAYVTENRKEQGLVLGHSVSRNINMVFFQRAGSRYGLTQPARETALALQSIQRINIKTASDRIPAGHLSGGNQQKIVFSKWLSIKPRLLILDEPTRGVDVGAKYEIYSIIRELAAQGTAVILVSSELPEAIAMSDRLLVMREGKLITELPTAGLSQETIMALATGAYEL